MWTLVDSVAGFSHEEFDIQIEKGALMVRGDKNAKEKHKFL